MAVIIRIFIQSVLMLFSTFNIVIKRQCFHGNQVIIPSSEAMLKLAYMLRIFIVDTGSVFFTCIFTMPINTVWIDDFKSICNQLFYSDQSRVECCLSTFRKAVVVSFIRL